MYNIYTMKQEINDDDEKFSNDPGNEIRKTPSRLETSWLLVVGDREFCHGITLTPGKGEKHCFLIPVLVKIVTNIIKKSSTKLTHLVLKCDGLQKNKHIWKYVAEQIVKEHQSIPITSDYGIMYTPKDICE